MKTDYRDRFGLTDHPFSKQFLSERHFPSAGFEHLRTRFQWLLSERGIGVFTGESGVGKTACLHALTRSLPEHQYQIIYLEDSLAGADDLYRTLAGELGLEPSFRRSALWGQVKNRLLKLNDENDRRVVVVIDDAHRLQRPFLDSLGAFMSFLFDSREILTVCLIGDGSLLRVLNLTAMRRLKTRVQVRLHLEPFDHAELSAYVKHCLRGAGCERQLFSDTALDAVFHSSKGVARVAGKLLSRALRIADEQGKDIVCDRIIDAARREVPL